MCSLIDERRLERIERMAEKKFCEFIDEMKVSADKAGNLVWEQGDTSVVVGKLCHVIACFRDASPEDFKKALERVFDTEVGGWADSWAESEDLCR